MADMSEDGSDSEPDKSARHQINTLLPGEQTKSRETWPAPAHNSSTERLQDPSAVKTFLVSMENRVESNRQ
ncbi:hypothetical protein RRG08_012270 [Elysia crispata]|uniref:Uncharacterized protein n=1 Tax=Elysia crispata TaxID=231223 RepID=A0AAE1EDI8_9GAST|nr:hypothetical protein RRG08_012270 [Elysia crispata]